MRITTLVPCCFGLLAAAAVLVGPSSAKPSVVQAQIIKVIEVNKGNCAERAKKTGTVAVCHKTVSSGKTVFVVVKMSAQSCAKDHSSHAGDYITQNGTCESK